MNPNGSAADARAGEIELERVMKAFGEVTAVDDVSFTVRGGEFFSLLGPSGCGKTTTLRLIAGFEAADLRPDPVAGRRRHAGPARQAQREHGVPGLRAVPAHDRGREHRVRAEDPQARHGRDRRSTRDEILRTVQLEGMEDRRPGQLSGGQQQRVALARALVNRPAALLLDEPLGALDLKLRKEMQLELKALQARTSTTFVYVTHDQEEAMTMSDRIAVMNGGVVEQLATPTGAVPAAGHGLRRGVHRRLEPDHAACGQARGRARGDGSRRRRADPRARPGNGRRRDRITVRPEWIKLVSGQVGPRASHRERHDRRRRLPRLAHAADHRPPDGRAAVGASPERRDRRLEPTPGATGSSCTGRPSTAT